MKTEFDNTENEALNKTDVNHSVLTLEHLAPYLPHNLKGYYMDYDYDRVIEVEGLYSYEDIYNSEHGDLSIQYFKPILRPINDVIKVIESSNDKFIPIIELFKLKTSKIGGEINSIYIKDDTATIQFEKTGHPEVKVYNIDYFEIDLEPNDICFSLVSEIHKGDEVDERFYLCGNEMSMYKKLLEWHFDVFGLIEKGLAISIHDVE